MLRDVVQSYVGEHVAKEKVSDTRDLLFNLACLWVVKYHKYLSYIEIKIVRKDIA